MKFKFLLIEGLFQVGTHIGVVQKDVSSSMYRFILGFKNKRSIINLKTTLFLLRRALFFLQKIIQDNGGILIVCSNKSLRSYLSSFATRNNFVFIGGPWVGGGLTNLKEYKKRLHPFDVGYHFSLSKYHEKYKKFINVSKHPSVVIFFGVESCEYALIEAFNLNIPIIALANTNFQLVSKVDYLIPCNTYSFEFISFFCYLMELLFRKKKKKL
jgi:ribosomal protein S2